MEADEDSAPVWKSSFTTENQVGPLSALLLNDGYTAYSADAGSAGRRGNERAADPALHAAAAFDDLLEERGFRIRMRPGTETEPASAAEAEARILLSSVESPPASEIVARMLRHSDNTTAEMLFKEIGKRAGSSARHSAVLAAFDSIRPLLDLSTELTDRIAIADGSGLSSYNRLSCRVVVELLRTAGADSVLVDGLAVVGESGTLSNCEADAPPVKSSAVIGDIRAKTGTLNDVTALAGVITADNADMLVFALIVNGQGVSTVFGLCDDLQKGVMSAVLGHPYGPAADDEALQPLPVVVTEPLTTP